MAGSSGGQSFRDRIMPWQCGSCGQQHISANKSDCPACHAPRAGSAASQSEDATGQTTREYEGEKAMRDGIALMARQGWRVTSQSSYQPSSGVGRTVALGFIGAAIFKPQARFVVVYERVTPTAPPAAPVEPDPASQP